MIDIPEQNAPAEEWGIFWSAPHNGNKGGQVGKSQPSQSAAILHFMKTYDISKADWEKGVMSGKYECKKVMV